MLSFFDNNKLGFCGGELSFFFLLFLFAFFFRILLSSETYNEFFTHIICLLVCALTSLPLKKKSQLNLIFPVCRNKLNSEVHLKKKQFFLVT